MNKCKTNISRKNLSSNKDCEMRNSQKRTNFQKRSCRRYKTERKRDIGFMSLLRNDKSLCLCCEIYAVELLINMIIDQHVFYFAYNI